MAVRYYIEKWSPCAPFVFNKLRDKTYLRFSFDSPSYYTEWRKILPLQPTGGFGLSNNVLPFFPICHQLSPSSHFQHLRSLSTSSFHLFLGLPLLLVPSISWVKIFLGILSSSILSRWPNQLILCPFIHFTLFSPLLISSSSRFVRLFHSPFSYLGPYILQNIFLSKISRACSSFFVNVHASAPYDTTDLISVLYNIILVALDKSRLLKILTAAKYVKVSVLYVKILLAWSHWITSESSV